MVKLCGITNVYGMPTTWQSISQ